MCYSEEHSWPFTETHMQQNVYWYSLKNPTPVLLQQNLEIDVAIVGGGMAGLMCALRLHTAGRKVVVLEKEFCGSGASGKSSGFLTPDSEIELSSLLESYGPEKAKELWQFVVSGVESIRSTVEKYAIPCDWQRQDSLLIASSKRGWKHVVEEHAARTELQYESTLYAQQQMATVLATEKYHGAVRYPETYCMNGYLYCQALKDILISLGVMVYEDSPVVKMDGQKLWVGNFTVRTEQTVLCMDRFTPDLGLFDYELYHVQTFLAISKPLTPTLVKQIIPGDRMLCWDTDLVYQYFRLTGDNRLLIGGADIRYTYSAHEKQQLTKTALKLQRYIQIHFPKLSFEIEYVWPGMLGVTKDLLPLAGRHNQNPTCFYIAAATGLPWAAALGGYIADKITKGESRLDEYFRADRKFAISPRVQKLFGKRVSYALANGVAKYGSSVGDLVLDVGREIGKLL